MNWEILVSYASGIYSVFLYQWLSEKF
ncbi:hypothetical protein SEA_BEESKNEES_60 [Mycobacterium phage BeesKnees]|nr:hypothetical protein SEA_BEESKNEES_60 [Mycobacterium phage BeesKnees]